MTFYKSLTEPGLSLYDTVCLEYKINVLKVQFIEWGYRLTGFQMKGLFVLCIFYNIEHFRFHPATKFGVRGWKINK